MISSTTRPYGLRDAPTRMATIKGSNVSDPRVRVNEAPSIPVQPRRDRLPTERANRCHDRATGRTVALSAIVALSASFLAGCGSRTPKAANSGTSNAASSLLPRPLPAGSPPNQFALHVLRGDNHATLLVAGVRINGQGPYPFLVDTGSGFSDIAPQLSRQLHLPGASPLAGGTEGAGCGKNQPPPPPPTTPRVQISHWQLGGVQLPATVAVNSQAVDVSGSGLDGRVGSDVLSQLSPLTIGYRTGRGTLGTTNPTSPSTPPSQQVPVKVLRIQGQVLVGVPATIAGHRYAFIVDTGAGRTDVTPSTAKELNLPVVQRGLRLAGVTCSTKTNAVALGDWHVGPVSLPNEDAVVGTVFNSGNGDQGLGGLIGGDVLSSFGTVTFDYTRQTLALGS
ncbi:MAG: hypothetical protein DLM54_10500 [Acidimicrobiales bacterium]|nr:MAG: hypothetical protein DLM54_10500 [Acidimicrobiales bacterium]